MSARQALALGTRIKATNSGSSNTGYAIYGLNNSATGWGEYQAGSSPNYFAASVGIGSTAPNVALSFAKTTGEKIRVL